MGGEPPLGPTGAWALAAGATAMAPNTTMPETHRRRAAFPSMETSPFLWAERDTKYAPAELHLCQHGPRLRRSVPAMTADSADTIVAAVLAGGAGRRIGGDKALIDLGGAPLVAHAARPFKAARALAVIGSLDAAARIG